MVTLLVLVGLFVANVWLRLVANKQKERKMKNPQNFEMNSSVNRFGMVLGNVTVPAIQTVREIGTGLVIALVTSSPLSLRAV